MDSFDQSLIKDRPADIVLRTISLSDEKKENNRKGTQRSISPSQTHHRPSPSQTHHRPPLPPQILQRLVPPQTPHQLSAVLKEKSCQMCAYISLLNKQNSISHPVISHTSGNDILYSFQTNGLVRWQAVAFVCSSGHLWPSAKVFLRTWIASLNGQRRISPRFDLFLKMYTLPRGC